MDISFDFHRQVLEHLAEGVYYVDKERRILFWNHAAEIITGFASEEVVGSYCFDNILNHIDDQFEPLCNRECPLTLAMRDNALVITRAFLHHKKGHRVPVNIKVNPVVDHSGSVIGAVEIFSDATSYLELETLNRELQKQIRIDPLTKLPNRRAFAEAVQQEFQRYHRYGSPFSVIFSDIDYFKKVNDQFGHHVGDLTLQWFSRKLQSGLRKVDLVSRFGGEEFIILLPSTKGESACQTAEKLRALIAQRPCIETGQILTASFGVASVLPSDSPDHLLERADRGLYAAKKQGRNRVVFQPDTMLPAATDDAAPSDSSPPEAGPEQ